MVNRTYCDVAVDIREKLFRRCPSRESPITEQQLAQEFGVSRTIVREALQVMDTHGLLERRKSKGLFFKTPTTADIVWLYDVRSALEGFACRLAAERIQPQDIKKMRANIAEYNRLLSTSCHSEWIKIDLIFHRKIVEISGNPWLLKLMDDSNLIHRTFISCLPSLYEKAPETPFPHERILETFEKKEGADECEKIMHNHVQWSKRRLLEVALDIKIDAFNNL